MRIHAVRKTSLAFLLLMLSSVLAAAQYVGEQGGPYKILSARYGTANRNIDVTQRLKQLASQNRTFRMGNSTFGTDPDPGQVKTLRIYARGRGGNSRLFEYREGSTVDGSMFSSWGGGDWGGGGWDGGWDGDNGQYQILSARYGTSNRNIDVTQRLKELASQDRTFRMGNSTFGTDPDPGRVKTLRIYARARNGKSRYFEYREGSTVDGSLFSGWGGGNWGGGGWNGGWDGGWNGGGNNSDSGQYEILSARYGTSNRNVDVTQRLKELARQDRTFRMGNSTFGTDPDPGHVKTLRIYTRGRNGQNRMFEYREGSTVDGSMFSGWSGGNWGNPGWNGGWNGGDGGGNPGGGWGNNGSLTINRATWGDGRRNQDVTSRVQSYARNGSIDITVDNSSMGGDPAPGSRKSLLVSYTIRGRSQQARVNEGDRLRIP